jgi:hypothetical protein
MGKKVSQKAKVKSAKFPVLFATGGRSSFTKVWQAGRIDSAIIAKLLPKNGEHISAGKRMVVT